MNLYSYVNNDAVNLFDLLGLDVVVVINSKAVNGSGHAGEIIGQPGGNYTFYSYGAAKGDVIDDGALEHHDFNSYDDAISFAKKAGYDKYERFKSDSDADWQAKLAAVKYGRQGYNVTSHNCQGMVNSSMDAAGIDYSGNSSPNNSYKRNIPTSTEHGTIQ